MLGDGEPNKGLRDSDVLCPLREPAFLNEPSRLTLPPPSRSVYVRSPGLNRALSV